VLFFLGSSSRIETGVIIGWFIVALFYACFRRNERPLPIPKCPILCAVFSCYGACPFLISIQMTGNPILNLGIGYNGK